MLKFFPLFLLLCCSHALAESVSNLVSELDAGDRIALQLLTGVNAQANQPYPAIFQVVEDLKKPDGKVVPLKGARIIAAAVGNTEFHRVLFRLYSLALRAPNGTVTQARINGWVEGRDGWPGIGGSFFEGGQTIIRSSKVPREMESTDVNALRESSLKIPEFSESSRSSRSSGPIDRFFPLEPFVKVLSAEVATAIVVVSDSGTHNNQGDSDSHHAGSNRSP